MDESKTIKRSKDVLSRVDRVVCELVKRRRFRQAAVAAEIAALYGAYNHAGQFIDSELEAALREIGKHSAGGLPIRPRAITKRAERILHVLTAAKKVGGDTRFVARWISRDPSRRYSLAVTNQMYFEVPPDVQDAVRRSGGAIHVLDAGGKSTLERARALRAISQEYDAVFLHPYVEDTVPPLAFFDRENLPPVVFVVQADHQCFVGLSACDSVVHLREASIPLSVQRRGVLPEKMSFLPIPLEPPAEPDSRAEARRKVGLPPDAIVLLTIARAVKYVPIAGPSFAEAMLPIVARHPQVHVLAIGPSDDGDWRVARDRSQGRVRALGQRSDTKSFYEAADVYVDSFPWASNTSLLEAGSAGLPLVTYFPWSEDASVLGAGAPGIDAAMLRVRTLEELEETLSELIRNPRLREERGQAAREQIAHYHAKEGWDECLRSVLRVAEQTTPGSGAIRPVEADKLTDLDHLLSGMYRDPVAFGSAVNRFAPDLGYLDRIRLLLQLARIDRSFSFGLFLPHRMARIVGPYLHGWRQLPLIGRPSRVEAKP